MSSTKVIGTLALISLLSLVSIGCSDSDDPVVPGAPAIDTMPPAIPTGLAASFSDYQVNISWATNTVDTDLVGFLVTKEHDGATSVLVSTPEMVQSIQDSPLEGLTTYKVISVDEAGNQSAYASINYTYVQPQRNVRDSENQF